MNDEFERSESVTETLKLWDQKKAELDIFLSKYQLPGRVNPSEKVKITSAPRRIPIVTERFKEVDGLYFNEPTIGDLMAMVTEVNRIVGKEDITLTVSMLAEYVVRHNSNVQLDASSRSSDYDEIRAFVLRSLQESFLSLMTYRDVVKEMEGQESIGSSEASVS